jgi:hypothetical protein
VRAILTMVAKTALRFVMLVGPCWVYVLAREYARSPAGVANARRQIAVRLFARRFQSARGTS